MNSNLSVGIQVFDAIHSSIHNIFMISTVSTFVILPTQSTIVTRLIQILVIIDSILALTARGGELAHNDRLIQLVVTGPVLERTVGRILTLPYVGVELIKVYMRDKNKHNKIMHM